MNSKKRLFFKGLPSFTSPNDLVEAREAGDSVYRWWWEFMRLSPVLWFARTRNVLPKDKQIADVSASFGDLQAGNFRMWWFETGRHIFAEAKRPARVAQVNLDELHLHPFARDKLYLEIPLTIRKQTILKQINSILNVEHDGRALDLAATSTAQYRLFTKRYRMRTLEIEYWTLLYKLLYEDITVWRIGDRLQLSPHLRVRDVDNVVYTGASPRDRLNSLTGRYLYKARFSVLNAERGSFPNYEKIEVGDRYQPFGLKLQTEFRNATESKDGVLSEWHQWLHEEFANSLKYEILHRNKIENGFRLLAIRRKNRLPDFISGKSDLLD